MDLSSSHPYKNFDVSQASVAPVVTKTGLCVRVTLRIAGDDGDNSGSCDSDGDDDCDDAVNDEDDGHGNDDTTVVAVRASGATKTLWRQQWGGAQTTIN